VGQQAGLTASEALVRSLFENAPAAIAIVEGPELRYVFSNPAHDELTLGRAALGRTARECFPGADTAPAIDLLERVLATGEAATLDAVPLPGRDGRSRYVDARFSPYHGADGAVVGVLIFILDVTDQVRARARSASLLAIANAFSDALTVEAVARAVVERIHDEVAAAATVFYLASDDGSPAQLLAHRGIPESTATRLKTLPLDTPVPLADALRRREPHWFETREQMHVSFPATLFSDVPAASVQAIVALPLLLGPRLRGGIAMSFATERRFDAAKREFLLSIASECALALERASLFQQNALEQERLRIALDAARLGSWEWDVASGHVHWSASLEVMHGLGEGTFPGTFDAWAATIHHEDVEGVLAATRHSVDTGERHELRYRIVRPDGDTRWVEAHGEVTRDGDGATRKLIGVCADITDRRGAELELQRSAEILRFLADASDALGSSLDPEAAFRALVKVAVPRMADWVAVDVPGEDGSIRLVALNHVDPAKVALGHELRRRFPPRMDAPSGVGRVLTTGEAEIVLDIPDELLVASVPDPELLGILRELGLASAMTIPLLVRGKPMGAITFIAAESRRRFSQADVTVATEVARRAAIALDHARAFREAQEANRLKDEFLGTVSHELRTPLNAILGWVSLLKKKKQGDDALARGLDTIERNARAQARLIEDVLDVSRIISGKLLIQRSLVDGEVVLRSALEVIAPMAGAKGVEVLSEIEPGVAFVGDADRLQQVAWNLLSNAIKFTPAGGHVWVTLARAGSQVELHVRDDGAGIPAELQPFVFDRFRQADSSPSRRHGGLGLGLAIVRHLVELHGGTVTVASDGEGKGTTFVVRLPVRAVQASEDRTSSPELGSAAPVSTRTSLRGVKVLVCDDDADARELLQVVLTSAGADVRVVTNAADALTAAASFAPAVLVSDIGMPGEDGYELLRRLRERGTAQGGEIPAIALTAYARTSDARRALASGFQVHLAKPIREDDLVGAVGRLAGRASQGEA
jgi:PAS domain S-box-containing protein